MRNKLVTVPSLQELIRLSPGFAKKQLSDFKLDILALCGFGCRYCSSNAGNYLRIHREEFATLTEQQLGVRAYPSDDPTLMYVWPAVISQLESQVGGKPKTWGAESTLVFSMLTDGFSPVLVGDGTTEAALRLVVERTSFRVRILTKNAVVGTDRWISFFQEHPDRFVVGLSTGTLDDEWASRIEIGTSSPSARLRALANLQEAGVPTYAMLCPIFPDMLEGDALERLVDRINPGTAEHVWAEPYNDRVNWAVVREGYEPGSRGHEWFTQVYGQGDQRVWSRYATELYTRLRDRARREGWIGKLRYLLYEDLIVAEDKPAYAGLEGVLLQSKPGDDGRSRNPFIAELQKRGGGSR